MRGHKRFAEAVDYYTRAIALIDKPEQKHWTYFYSRGTCYERLKKWALAEADLQQGAAAQPRAEPLVLNYLGYTWIDQNRNLKQGLALIEKAVRQKPDDGYIVDSLGWAHLPHGQLQGGREASGARGRAAARGPGAQRSPGRRLLARRPRARGPLPVGAGADAEARARRRREDQAKLPRACRTAAQARQVKRTKEVQKRPEKRKKSTEVKQPSIPHLPVSAGAPPRLRLDGCRLRIRRRRETACHADPRDRPRQDQPDADACSAGAPTAITSSKAS